MQRPNHRLKFVDGIKGIGGRIVKWLRRKEAKRIVAPVVGKSLGYQMTVVDMKMNWQQFDRGDAQLSEMLYGRLTGKPGISSSQVLRNFRMQFREAAHMQFVYDGIVH